MNTHPDFKELFRLLGENRVEYMIVGGYAVSFYGYPRFTKDIDIFFDSSEENIDRLIAALTAFAFSREDLRKDLFIKRGNVITFGSEPSRVDLLNDIDGVRYADAKVNAVPSIYGGVPVKFISRDDLMRNKRATSRVQDKLDVEILSQRG